MKLRVGVIGTGPQWRHRHAPALLALRDRFEVRAVFDEVSLLAQAAAREFSAAPVDGYRALVGRADVDAVMLLAPQWCGPLPIWAACDEGKAVYSAVLPEVNAEASRAMRERVERAGISFAMEFSRRLAPASLRLKELIATRLGRPKLMFCHERIRWSSRDDRRLPEDVLERELVELVDWCCFMSGDQPTSVSGVLHRGAGGDIDYQMLSLDFAGQQPGDGLVAQISCGRYIPTTWHEALSFRPTAALQVCCENGIAFVDLPYTLVWFDEAGRHQESLESERPPEELLLTRFHRSVMSLVRQMQDLDETARAIEIVCAARRSASAGTKMGLT